MTAFLAPRDTDLAANPGMDPAVADAYAALSALAESGRDAAPELTALRGRHPDVTFSLVSDRESYDGSVSSALIIRRPGTPAVSLAVGAATELPWPLRGVVRSSEADLLAVNGTRLDVAEAMVRLDSMLFDPQPMRMLIDGCLLDEALADDPVDLTPDAIQRAADGFRRAKGLHRRADTERWLADRGLTADDFTAIVVRHAELAALRDRVTAALVDDWFDGHARELDTLVLAWIDAAAAPGGIAEAPGDVAAGLARDPLAAIVDAARAGAASGVTQVRAGTAPELLDATPGLVCRVDLEMPAVAVVISREPAVLDDRTRAEVGQRLFREWLAERRAAARVTWFWGDRRRTGS